MVDTPLRMDLEPLLRPAAASFGFRMLNKSFKSIDCLFSSSLTMAIMDSRLALKRSSEVEHAANFQCMQFVVRRCDKL